MTHLTKPKERWGTRIGVILAVAGSAVGLGNFLRFPGLAAQYEGGAFMIPYFVAFFVVGLPIAWVEWTLGRHGGGRGYNSTPGIFRAVTGRKRPAYLGVIGLIVPVIIYMFYVYVEAWCLGYAFNFLTGGLDLGEEPKAYRDFWGTFIGIEKNGGAFDLDLRESVLPFLLICIALNFFLIWRGLNKGIELFCQIAMPLLLIIAVVVLVRVLTLPGMSGGLAMTWNPTVAPQYLAAGDETVATLADTLAGTAAVEGDVTVERLTAGEVKMPAAEDFRTAAASAGWTPARADRPGGLWQHEDSRLRLSYEPTTGVVSLAQRGFFERLLNANMWLAAAGQIFFSLSVGFGVIITYSSYLRRNDDVALSSLTAASGNGFAEVCIGGMLTIPAAFAILAATGVNEAGDSLFGLGFITLPNVFAVMPFGQLFGFLFFFLLFLAAVTSSLSMLQPAIAFLEEAAGIGRHASVAILGVITIMGTFFVVYFSAGLTALDTLDWWIANLFMVSLALIQVVLFGWVLGAKKGVEELKRGAEIQLPRLVGPVIKYISPLFLLTLLGWWVYETFIKPAVTEGEKLHPRIQIIAENTSAQMAVGLIVLVGLFFLLLIGEAQRRWNRREAAAAASAQTAPASDARMGGER